jgi:DNA-binding MarR family transcriptional regulator
VRDVRALLRARLRQRLAAQAFRAVFAMPRHRFAVAAYAPHVARRRHTGSETMKNTPTTPNTKRWAAPRRATQPRPPLTLEQRAGLDALHEAAKPGFKLDLGPVGGDVVLSARVARAKRYGYGAPTAVLFLDALPALDALTRTEFRVLLRALARAPFGDNIAPISAAAIAREIGLDRSHAAAAIRSLARAGILIEDEASQGAGRKFYRITPRLLWRGGAYGYHAALAARPPLAIRTGH